MANMPALRKAFDAAASDDASGCHVIKAKQFRDFLGNVFFYNKIFLAFDIIDTDKVGGQSVIIVWRIAVAHILIRFLCTHFYCRITKSV